jgi:hypothetical protein
MPDRKTIEDFIHPNTTKPVWGNIAPIRRKYDLTPRIRKKPIPYKSNGLTCTLHISEIRGLHSNIVKVVAGLSAIQTALGLFAERAALRIPSESSKPFQILSMAQHKSNKSQ